MAASKPQGLRNYFFEDFSKHGYFIVMMCVKRVAAPFSALCNGKDHGAQLESLTGHISIKSTLRGCGCIHFPSVAY